MAGFVGPTLAAIAFIFSATAAFAVALAVLH